MGINDPFGPVRRWREGDILYAENDWLRMAFVATDDESKWGKPDWYGPKQIGIEYIPIETAKRWDSK